MKEIKSQIELPYKNKEVFVGIDTHKRSWSVSIRIDNTSMKTFSMDPSPDLLVKHLVKNYPLAKYKCVYEAGFGGFWIHEALVKENIECLVVHACDIPTTHKEKNRKTDKNDARKLALELERGSLEGIYIPSREHQVFRTLSRSREQAVTDVTRVKNRIKGIVNFYGIELPEHSSGWSKKFIAQLRDLDVHSDDLKDTLTIYLDDLEHQMSKHDRILCHIKKILEKRDPELLKRVQSIPGVGLKSATGLIGEIWDMSRFENIDKLKSFVGLIPSTHSSGETIREATLTMRRNRFLRKILIESAWVAMRHDKVLTDQYFKLKSRMIPQRAITRIAKKLLSRLRAVWLGEYAYAKGLES
jgi:transposase